MLETTIAAWILAFASMTKRWDLIPALGFGFLRRSTDYIHVVEGRYDYCVLDSGIRQNDETFVV
jgi:hypothetical protein